MAFARDRCSVTSRARAHAALATTTSDTAMRALLRHVLATACAFAGVGPRRSMQQQRQLLGSSCLRLFCSCLALGCCGLVDDSARHLVAAVTLSGFSARHLAVAVTLSGMWFCAPSGCCGHAVRKSGPARHLTAAVRLSRNVVLRAIWLLRSRCQGMWLGAPSGCCGHAVRDVFSKWFFQSASILA